MTKAQLAQVDLPYITQMYDKWKSEVITYEEYSTFMCDLMENFIKSRIAKLHRTISAEYEDAMQEGRLAVLQQLGEYDPHKGIMPSSYFIHYIDDGTKKACKNDTMSTHYVKLIGQLEKAVRAEGYSGLSDPNLTEVMIADIAGVSVNTVKNALDVKGVTTVSLEAASENREFVQSDIFKNPEAQAIQKEIKENIRNIMKEKCSDFEAYLLEVIHMDSDNMSFKKVSDMLNKNPKLLEQLGESRRKVDPLFIEQTVNHALRKFRNSPEIKKLRTTKPKKNTFTFSKISLQVQVNDEDLENIINL